MTMIKDLQYTSPRTAIGSALISLAKDNPKVVVIDADLASSVTTDQFREVYPDRFFEMGIAEQNCMGVADGFAAEGFIPFFASMAMFAVGTAWTQLRQACYANRNIKVIGTHPGVDDGPDGASHHALEDLAMTRTIPNLVVMTPSDEWELRAAINQAAQHAGPVYIRVARDNLPILHDDRAEFPIGQSELLKDEGRDFAILYEGAAAAQAVEAYNILEAKGKKGRLLSIRTLNPLDTESVLAAALDAKVVITVENHSIHGGLGGAVAEVLAGQKQHGALRYVGIRHCFTESGSIADLKKKYGLTAEEVVRQYESAAGE